jgi:hypothetical protein
MATRIGAMDFVEISKIVRPDAQKRITLPNKLVKEGILFRMSYNSIGQILLEPQVTIPESEAWVFQNPEILALAKRGLEAAAKGKVSKIDLDNL